MELLQAILLGLIQGLTEFLPVSSSGHLILVPHILGLEDQGLAMDALLHLATLLAIVIYFRKDLSKLLISLWNNKKEDPYRSLAWSIIFATIPAGIAGLLFGDWIENNLRSAQFVAGNLILWSAVFFVADRKSTRQESDSEELIHLGWKKVLLIGFAQAIALIPGTSRSGITITAGLFSNLSQPAAARFSFLLGTPIILAAGLHKSLFLFNDASQEFLFTPFQFLMGFLAAFVIGYLSIKWLLAIVSRVGLLPFIVYRVLLAGFIFIFLGQ
ncbi:MAG: undecaprenyl-diphosphatase UppP [Nitrospinota bacterium]|nr:undecaprenyl-diphosphatase UppP [Nitrospinota bacterium]